MTAALINGFLGLAMTFAVGVGYFGLNSIEIVQCVLVSNAAGLVSLLITLKAERQPWVLKYILNRSLKTWAFIITFYFGLLLLFSPPLRDIRVFFALVLPLMFSTGFAIILFGPIQDYLVRRQQRKS